MDDQAPLGANHQQIKEAVKWEIEIHERKNEERFKEIEGLIKKIGVKIDKQHASIVEDTTNEFQNLKTQFEDFGNTIYDRLQNEFQEKLTLELTKSLSELQDSLNTDLTSYLGELTKPIDVKLLTLEGQCEELRQAQELALEELNKYQDNIERIIEQNQEQMTIKVESLSHEFSRLKDQHSKRPNFDEYLYVKDSVFTDSMQEIEERLGGLTRKIEAVATSNNRPKDSEGVTSLDLS